MECRSFVRNQPLGPGLGEESKKDFLDLSSRGGLKWFSPPGFGGVDIEGCFGAASGSELG